MSKKQLIPLTTRERGIKLKLSKPIIIVGIAAALTVGCGGKRGAYKPTLIEKIPVASVQSGDEANLFPVTVGSYWTYTLTDVQQVGDKKRQRELTLTFKVTASSDFKDGKKATIDIVDDKGNVAESQTWYVLKTGVYQGTSGSKKTPYNPMQPAITFPVTAGTKSEWKGTGVTPIGAIGPITMKLNNLGAQEVDTDGSRMSAYCVAAEGDFSVGKAKGKVISSGWFAPNIGMVRTRIEAAIGNIQVLQVFKLKKYEVKK